MRKLVLITVLMLASSAAMADEPVAKKITPPDMTELARQVLGKAETQRASWEQTMGQLANAITRYADRQGSLHLMPEKETLDALQRGAEILVQDGEVVESLVKKAGLVERGLEDVWKKAPPYYRAASAEMRAKASQMRAAQTRAKYQDAAEIWESLATLTEQRVSTLTGSRVVLWDQIQEDIEFHRDLVKTLRQVPRDLGEESSGSARVMASLESYANRSDDFHNSLIRFRDELRQIIARPQTAAK